MEHYGIRDEQVAWRVVDGEAVLVHADTSAYYGLNRMATDVWLALADLATSRDGLARLIAERYDVDAETAGRDVGEFLDALVEEGLALSASDPADGVRPEPAASDGSASDGSPSDGWSSEGSTREDAPPEPGTPYEPPRLERFGQLETLILSGE